MQKLVDNFQQMSTIRLIQRPLTPVELEFIDSGFDQLSLEEGVELESTERISLVALHDDVLIACVSGLAHKNGTQYSGWFHLTELFVDKKYRDKGIGSRILRSLEKSLFDIDIHNIWLWTSGDPTIRFYERHGYDQFVEMKNWYSDGSSRIGFRKLKA